jgi:hypothetical protein
MAEVSMTCFVDFVSKAGTPKFTVVKEWKNKDDYHPATDFYKAVRDGIVEMHKKGKLASHLTGLLSGLKDQKKITAYPPVVQGYKKWMGKKSLTWFTPPVDTWSHAGLDVKVNPEVGLEVNGVPHLLKLYFKAEPLTKNRIDLITHMMSATVGSKCPAGCVMGVFDIRNAKVITPTVPIPTLNIQLKGEAAYWMTIWPSV